MVILSCFSENKPHVFPIALDGERGNVDDDN